VRILLDTCAFIWLITDAPELSTAARSAFCAADNEVYLSAVSAWEIALKYSLGRIDLQDAPNLYVPRERERHGIEALPLDETAALHLTKLPLLHKDPFDRMLVCQALAHGLVILTPDDLVRQYPIRTVW
jgi:PIN domain nuclease of toxin-antitoxin system